MIYIYIYISHLKTIAIIIMHDSYNNISNNRKNITVREAFKVHASCRARSYIPTAENLLPARYRQLPCDLGASSPCLHDFFFIFLCTFQKPKCRRTGRSNSLPCTSTSIPAHPLALRSGAPIYFFSRFTGVAPPPISLFMSASAGNR